MKILFALLVGVGLFVFGFFAFLPANAVRACYSLGQKELDDLAFRMQSQVVGDQSFICTGSHRVIETLSSCEVEAKNKVPEALRQTFLPVVDSLVGMLRYEQKDLSALKENHDQMCTDYPDYMFSPPDYLITGS